MDVSFTNVLEGARQYFQGLPVPSTGGGAATSVDLHATSSTNSASSTSTTTTHDHDASQPTQSISTSVNGSSSGSNGQESNRYPTDVRPSLSVESSNASGFWNPHVEPYPPQPTKVEVPDTRPGDESSAMEPSSSSSSGTVTLTEMQPSNHQSSSSSSSSSVVASNVASSTNFSQRSPPTSSSSSSSTLSSNDHNHHHQLHPSTSNLSSHLHQMQPPQPPHSPGPVYQQLNNVSRSSFNTAEILASSTSHPVSTYQMASNNDRQSQPIVVQRAQYYPRYHHPDITKCAPAPYSQSSIYQSANVAQPSSTVQQPSTRPTPMEQNNASSSGIVAQGHCPPEQQRVPGTYGSNVPPVQNPLGGSTVYGSGSPSSSQNYRSTNQYQQQAHRLATNSASSLNDRSHSSDGAPHSSTVPFSSSSAISPRQPAAGNSSSSHIPSQSQSQNLPGHIPSSSVASSVHHQQQQQYPSRINVSPHSHGSSGPYGSRVLPPPPHGVPTSTSSAAAANHPQQHMPPPSSGYHAGTTPSPHHEMPSHHVTPSPHHATPSPQRQSPHVSNLHNPHASPSPHHTPSPHNSFQPHSPTYPPPPPPPASSRSTPHSYNLPSVTSQHYQTNYAARDMAVPYAPAPSSQSSYHSFQKSSQSESQGSNYYSQSGRSHSQPYGMQQMLASQTVFPGTPNSNNLGSYQQNGSKHTTYNDAEIAKRSATDAATPYATHRSSTQRNSNTHNLPPIAALSSYHSNRREPLGKSAQSMVQRQRIHSTNANSKMAPAAMPPTTPSSMPAQRLAEYPMTPASVMNHAIPVNGRTTTVTNMTYGSRYSGQQGYLSSSYATTLAPSHHGSNSTSSTTVTSISHGGIGGARSSVSTIHAYQSSDESDRAAGSSSHHHHHHHHQPRMTTENYGYKEYPPYQNLTSSSGGQTAPAAAMASSPSPSSAVRKRESPLDLSVKTVKTSADSTAQDDLEATSTDKHVSSSNLGTPRSNVSRPMPPPPAVHQSAPAQPSYSSSYDSRPSSNSSRNSMPVTCVRASTPQAVCAPKVDFLPDFNSAPLRHQSHHENPLRRSSTQLYVPPAQPLSSHQANNTAPLPHMSTFKKRPLPTSLYDGLTIPPPSSSSSASSASYLQTNDSSRFSKYSPMIDPSSRVGPPTLPAQDYAPDPNKYYLGDNRAKFDQQFSQRERMPFKRAGEAIYGIGSPSKQPRVSWRVPSTDKQIAEPKLSTASALNEQQKRQEMNLPVPLPNGTLVTPGVYDQRLDSGGYSAPESSRYQPAYCDKKTYPESKVVRSLPSSYSHPITSKPNANMHVLPQQLSGASSIYSPYRQTVQKMTSSLSVTSGGQPIDQPSNTGADKRVLSLLRNSLENKQQRDEQLNSQQPILVNHSQQSFQNKVVAPVEPKTNIGRHNLSPFTAASLLERNSNTPPHYKLHVPRAIDSITQEAPRSMYASRVNASATLPGKEASLAGPRGAENQIHRDKDDGLAAILAAKIRTKAELKQVGTGQFTKAAPQDISSTPREIDNAASTSTPQSGSSAGSPPKLTREKMVLPPRRRLFSRTDDDNMPVPATVPVAVIVAPTVPTRASGCRSSSETSIFDFRESDSDGEMPVLERQSLEEMRRDRKQLSKVQPPIPLNDAVCMNMASSTDLVKIELKENDKINEMDPFWSTACDKFMEQLRAGDVVKKRGRRKKMSGTTTSKPEDAANDSDKESDTNAPQSRKSEDIKESLETNQEDKNLILKDIKIKTEPGLKKDDDKHSNDDSDEVPLIKRKKLEVKKEDSDCDEEVICRRRRVRRGSRIKLESSSGSESSSEDSDASTELHGSSVADRLRARKRPTANASEGMKLRSRDTTPHKVKPEKESKMSTPPKGGGTSQKAKPKPLFGDGSDFRPGWEEEVYVYKKSLRMPTRLITVSKPSRFHRLSTSLPDLDPGSPALSVSMDSSDVCLSRNKRLIDSDMESNYSYSIIGLGGKIDDEEATSSTTVSCPPKTMTKHFRSENNSIVDVLAQKVGSGGGGQKDSKKKQNSKTSKILNKSSNEPELLPTPSLAPLVSETSKNSKNKISKNNKNPIKVANSVLIGYFRKETVNNFRDAFKNNHTLPNEFSTMVLKSRTRTETKVLKKEATIREVFGEDRPASAPPMQNHDDTSQDDDSQNETPENALGKARTLKQKVVSRLRSAGILRSHKAIANSKRHLLTAERRKDLLKSLANKKLHRIKTEMEQEETNDVREENNDEDDKNDLDMRNKKKLKLRPGRRKFRSGFDYIRKKKKPLKKDESLPKERKRQSQANKPSPECVADIQSEIRTWVIKKGVGETILHRAARLGYTDVTAYCLEKLNSASSPKDNAGYTPLHEACSKGHLEIAKLLLAYGANVSESANGGIRPLHEAAENGATELVRLLLSYGADPLLATYSGQTPLMLAVDTEANAILEQHLDDIQGRVTVPWSFAGPTSILDPEETGYNPLDNVPSDSPESVELNDVEMEVSDINLPVLFTLNNDPDKWVLLQDLMTILRIKSRDALLRQINPKAHSGPPAIAHRDVMRELKLPDFLEQTRCCHLLSGGERINVRGSKVTLIKYNDKVKSLLNVEKVLISLR